MEAIRSYNLEKKRILTNVYQCLQYSKIVNIPIPIPMPMATNTNTNTNNNILS